MTPFTMGAPFRKILLLRAQLGLVGRVRIHPLFVLLVALAIGFGLWRDTLVLFLIVLLHEFGHAFVAQSLGYEIEEISLLPFGGVAKLAYGNLGFTPEHEAAIAIAGPCVNFLLLVVTFFFDFFGLWPSSFAQMVFQLNLWIGIFNLLPALPLDGGRILRAARSRSLGYEHATLEAYDMAIVISVILLAIAAFALWSGNPHVGILILGIFLFAAAWTGRRQVAMETIRFLDAKAKKNRKQPQFVRAIAAHGSVPIREVVRKFAPDRYHLVYMTDEEDNIQTIFEEKDLLEAVFVGNWLETLESWSRRP